MKKTLGAVSTMPSLPEDIQVDIFMKLPVKSIGNCRCVCKLWCNLLCSPKFVKYHLNYNIQNKNNHMLMCLTRGCYSIYSTSIYFGSVSSSPWSAVDYVEILGSSNGLVCLGIYSGKEIHGDKFAICIWNPLIREIKEISIPHPYFYLNVRHGFGYDCNNDTYKLVRIEENNETGGYGIKVYTLGSDSWNNIQSAVPYSSPCGSRNNLGLLFKGALHWLGTNTIQETSVEVIVSFEISTERILDVSLPEDAPAYPYGRRWFRSVAVLGDNLCLFSIDYGLLAEIWVMLEYGDRESWTKQFSITRQTNPSFGRYLRLVCALENGDILMVGAEKFVVYDPKKKKLRDLNVQTESNRHNKAVSYLETLVSPLTRVLT